jgi:hypothetical protein
MSAPTEDPSGGGSCQDVVRLQTLATALGALNAALNEANALRDETNTRLHGLEWPADYMDDD